MCAQITSSLCPLDSRCTICTCSPHLQSLVRPKPYVWPLLCVFFPHLCLLTSSLCHKSHSLATGLCLMLVKVAKKHKTFIYSGEFHREPGSLLQQCPFHPSTAQHSKHTRLFYFSVVQVRETSEYEGACPRIVKICQNNLPIACPIPILPGRFSLSLPHYTTH